MYDEGRNAEYAINDEASSENAGKDGESSGRT